VLAYVEQYAEELRKVGEESFRRAHAWPSLVVLGMAGDLAGSRSSGTSIINVADSVMERGSLTGRVFPVMKAKYSTPGAINVGRTSENDIVIPEYSISRKHCFIALVDGVYRISDCGSANGTLIDGVQIAKQSPQKLRGGESLTLGRLLLLFLPPREFHAYITKLVPTNEFA